MEESAWYSKCRTFKVSGCFPRKGLWKTWNEVIRSNLKERKVGKDLQPWTKYLRPTLIFM